MQKKQNSFVSVVLIAGNETNKVSIRTRNVADILRREYSNYEVVVVDNGLTKKELLKLSDILKSTPCIRVLRLAKNVDIDTAIFAGLETTIGDYVCVLSDQDPIKCIPEFLDNNRENDIVFGIAKNLKRKSRIESIGARLFYWYNRKYMDIDIPINSTYFMSFNRTSVNALTKGQRYARHIRHLAKQVGFSPSYVEYKLPDTTSPYSGTSNKSLAFKGVDILSNYSSHPLRAASYFGIFASILNVFYAIYIVIVNIARNDVEKGWTTLSLQSSVMFFFLFLALAIISEYIGKILVESRNEPPYNIMQELSSTISLADETRRNVTK